jgi:hypothetical protein
MPRLEIFQSLWAMERRRPDGEEWPLERQFEMIAQAGFDGAGIDHAARETPATDRARTLYRDHGLACLITAFPATTDDLSRTLDVAVALDARMVCINARYFPLTVAEGADFVRACLQLGAQARVPVYFETHRLTLTNDLLYTLQLLEQVPELQLVADLSHFVVAREFPAPVDRRHHQWVAALLARSVALQGRVATREQVQVPLHFPQHRPWVDQFFAWWQLGAQLWCKRMPQDAVLNFMCELGPPPYALTGADGYELSDRWQEALLMKQRMRAMWDARQDTPNPGTPK